VQVPIVSKDQRSSSVFNYFVSVQEQYLRQKDAISMWKKEEEENTNKGRKSSLLVNPAGGLKEEVQQDVYVSVAKHLKSLRECNHDVSKRPKCFKSNKACIFKRKEKLRGGTLKNGLKRSARNWGDCCWLCFKRGDCKRWTYKYNSKPSKRGHCYLKAKGGFARIPATSRYVSGYVSSRMYGLVLLAVPGLILYDCDIDIRMYLTFDIERMQESNKTSCTT